MTHINRTTNNQSDGKQGKISQYWHLYITNILRMTKRNYHLDLSESTLITNRIKRRENRLPNDLVIGSKVVNLLLEYTGPEVFTYKLHNVQLILKPCCVFSQSRGKNKRDG